MRTHALSINPSPTRSDRILLPNRPFLVDHTQGRTATHQASLAESQRERGLADAAPRALAARLGERATLRYGEQIRVEAAGRRLSEEPRRRRPKDVQLDGGEAGRMCVKTLAMSDPGVASASVECALDLVAFCVSSKSQFNDCVRQRDSPAREATCCRLQ